MNNNSSIISSSHSRTSVSSDHKDDLLLEDDEDEVMLPGFRFHPTDEELVGFYLRRKVDKKPILLELIRQIDIYKYDPWDLPKISSMPDKEGYFFCKRGRKYRNSIRPNRVTGSGFWKATGIDKPVYPSSSSSSSGIGSDGNGLNSDVNIIGLKKTLVYYRGSAGKGTKTDWMMHEFRLPAENNNGSNGGRSNNGCYTDAADNVSNDKADNPTGHEAEVWTICRIFKRNVSHRKYTPSDWRQSSTKRHNNNTNITYNNSYMDQTSSSSSSPSTMHMHSHHHQNPQYISFESPLIHHHQIDKKPGFDNQVFAINDRMIDNNQLVMLEQQTMRSAVSQPNPTAGFSSSPSFMSDQRYNYGNNNNDRMLIDSFDQNNWDELRSVVDFALNNPSLM